MPKNSDAFLTRRYGLITDYLAEAFHYQLKHSNRYEEVRKRLRLGHAVEGRDEKGIKKTLCAFLKILHPADQSTDEVFEEYVAYAVECRRRIKEQMNKRKPDDEFARIDLSYIDANGKEIVVYCPESRNATATLEPARRRLETLAKQESAPRVRHTGPAATPATSISTPQEMKPPAAPPPLTEQHFSIQYGDTGYSYETIFGSYFAGAKAVTIEDPYIRAPHQIANFVRFCETVVGASPTVQRINLITGYDDKTDLAMVRDKLEELKQSLLEVDVFLDIKLSEKIHDREVRIDNGWTVKIGRGLDFYQKADGWFSIGASDLGLRKCLETKVDIFKQG
jgi:ATP-dependent Lon protease